MSEKRFSLELQNNDIFDKKTNTFYCDNESVCDLLNEQQELIEELQVSDEMGWKRAEKFEKELKQKKIYIKRLEYKVQKFKEENEQLRKIGVMYQGHNPCEICTYSLENKVCCAVPNPISCDDAKKNFVQGLCKNHKQFQKSFRRYDDE